MVYPKFIKFIQLKELKGGSTESPEPPLNPLLMKSVKILFKSGTAEVVF